MGLILKLLGQPCPPLLQEVMTDTIIARAKNQLSPLSPFRFFICSILSVFRGTKVLEFI